VQVWLVTDVQGYMGHAHISTTMVYAHFKPHTDAASRLTQLVSAATGAGAWDRSGTDVERATGLGTRSAA
jgi:hypothetical protein